MLPRYITWLALLLSASTTIAQTSTSCNPTEKTCPDDTGLASSTYTHDFTTSGADSDAWNTTAGNVTSTSSGLEFTITKSGDAPTIQSKWYIFFGRVSFFLRAAPGTGIVSSAILESDDLDELDWEWLGGSDYVSKVQTNYFGKGNTTSYDRAAWAAASDTQTTTHNYTIVWTSASTTWYVDEVAIRTLNYADAVSGKNYPQTPMNIRIGIWAGGDSANDEGTIEWAGGATDYANGPFTMYLEKVEVVNDNPGASYAYGDLTGDYSSIKVNDADATNSSSSSLLSSSSGSTGSGSESESSTATVASSASATKTGMWWTASASAAVAQAATSPALRLGVGTWQYGVICVSMVLVAVW
ncbi:glycoside hydrolase family 16 protein [Didymella exigua CBS 183.55]|uniref:Crh-like protein n=1 Tax=Didymella exigua CBS 183.55 TaxID=1150837 RepID=A0A6A5RVS0_9PLEO|nr:glycoside hydrolase family 16 protein [Didymella exigua CBS 183.55]KAF1932561.1 glycoside hydrolase family 16 protein [Didymella exigua CBS 183.55]